MSVISWVRLLKVRASLSKLASKVLSPPIPFRYTVLSALASRASVFTWSVLKTSSPAVPLKIRWPSVPSLDTCRLVSERPMDALGLKPRVAVMSWLRTRLVVP